MSVTLKVVALTVSGSIGSLKAALMVRVRQTLVAPRAGLINVTVGAVVSAVAPVAKGDTWLPGLGASAKR